MKLKVTLLAISVVALVMLIGTVSFLFIDFSEPEDFGTTPVKTYENVVYGYSFDYPDAFDTIEYTNNIVAVSTSTSIDIEGVFESAAYVSEEGGLQQNSLEGFMVHRAKLLCDADGLQMTIYCDEVEESQSFTNAHGVPIFQFTLRKVTENLANGEKTFQSYGPIFAADISANVPTAQYAIVLIHPPYITSRFDSDNYIIAASAQSFRITEPQVLGATEGNAGGRVRGPENVSLKTGETKEAAGLTITFNRLVQDSRCPIDVQCIQAGAVNTNITLQIGDQRSVQNYASDGVPLEFAGYAVSIIDVNPPARSSQPIVQPDYRVTFNVAPTAKGDNI